MHGGMRVGGAAVVDDRPERQGRECRVGSLKLEPAGKPGSVEGDGQAVPNFPAPAAANAYDADMAVMSADQAREYARRWQQARLREAEELRETSPELKLRQLAALVASRSLFSPDPWRERDSRAARERWHQLRLALGRG
jgi:hypothetical protein